MPTFLSEESKFCEFCLGETQSPGSLRRRCGYGFGLSWEHTFFVAVAEDIPEDFLEILLLRLASGEGTRA